MKKKLICKGKWLFILADFKIDKLWHVMILWRFSLVTDQRLTSCIIFYLGATEKPSIVVGKKPLSYILVEDFAIFMAYRIQIFC